MFQFTHPILLAGLVAALTPLIIYLLLRRRKTEVRWGASYLLRLTLASKRRSSIWRQLVVLAVRCLILALAALLLSQLVRRNPTPAGTRLAPPPQPVHRAVIVDNSLSLSCRDGKESRADRMRDALGSMLRSQRPCDTVTLLPLFPGGTDGSLPTPVTIAGRPGEAAIKACLAGIRLREGVTRLAPALVEALTRLSATPRARQELFLFSDFPRGLEREVAELDWFPPVAAARGLRVAPVNFAGSGVPPATVALHAVTLGTDVAAAGVPLSLYVDVENCADTPQPLRLAITLDDRPAGSEETVLQPNERRQVAHTVVFSEPGIRVVGVDVAGSRMDMDTRYSLAVDVRQAPKIWVVANESRGLTADAIGEGEFLMRALVPQGTNLLQVESPEFRAITQPIPDTVDVIIVAGFPLTVATGKPLTAFVRRGGGLVLGLGPDVKPATWNECLADLLPAPLEQPWRESVDPEVFVSVNPAARAGRFPLFSEFATDRNGAAGDIRVYNYMTMGDGAEPDGVVLSLTGGDAYLLHRQVGRGHVWLVASSLGISWSSLAVQQAYLPLLYRLVGAAMAGRGVPRNLEPGQAFVTPWGADDTVTLMGPDRVERPLATAPGASHPFVTADSPGPRGLYRLQGKTGARDAFTVRGAFPESDLRSLTPEASTRLGASLGAPILAGWPAAVAALGAADLLQAAWPWLLAALLALYLFETWFVRTL
jgi:hypothetical protein